MNIYNCASPDHTDSTAPDTTAPADQPGCFPPTGACLPVVPGAKHKLSRAYKLTKLAERVSVPSALAAGALHLTRRFLLGKIAANPLEAAAFLPRELTAVAVKYSEIKKMDAE